MDTPSFSFLEPELGLFRKDVWEAGAMDGSAPLV